MEPTIAGAEAPSTTTRTLEGRMTAAAAALLLAGAVVFLWQAPGSYQVFKAIHVAAAVVWVGGGAGLTIMALLAQRTNDTALLLSLGKQAAFLGERIFTPASFIALGFGIAMVEKVHWGWGVFWIDFALAGWAVSTLIGIGYLSPASKKLNALMATKQPDDQEVRGAIGTLIGVARFDVVLLVLIVLDMAAKPTF